MIKLTRRAALIAATAQLAIPAITRRSVAATPLVIYSAFEDGQIKPLIDAFKKQHADADVQHFHQPGEQLLATLELELRARAPKADVVGLNDASLNYLQSKHRAFETYAAQNVASVRPELQNKEHFFTPAFVNLYLIQYNTKKITADAVPRTWLDLLDPKWKNQIAMADPSSSQSIQTFIWFIADYLGKKQPDIYGWNYFKRLAANNVRLEASHGTIRDLTVSGERPIGIQLLANAQTSVNRGDPTSSVWPREGSPGELSGFGVIKASPHAVLANAWLDFILTPEAQALMPLSLGGSPVRTDISYKFPDGTPVDKVTIVPVDSAYTGANAKAQAQKFHAALGQ